MVDAKQISFLVMAVKCIVSKLDFASVANLDRVCLIVCYLLGNAICTGQLAS